MTAHQDESLTEAVTQHYRRFLGEPGESGVIEDRDDPDASSRVLAWFKPAEGAWFYARWA